MSIERLPQIWPEWTVEKCLGEGSYGKVYQVVRHDAGLTAHAAIKVISIPPAPGAVRVLQYEGLSREESRTYLQNLTKSFVNEIQIMESLKGMQNLVSIEDYRVLEKEERDGWDIFIRMELLTPVDEYLSGREYTEADVIQMGCDICAALEICGRKGVIHRDIKPENIFVNDLGFYKIGDFGIARKLEGASVSLSQKGTFHYMAPEVAMCAGYDARVDIYSLGLVMYRFMNRNRLPFQDTKKRLLDPAERELALEKRLRGDSLPAPCQASADFARVILKACAYRPEDRYQDAAALRRDLILLRRDFYGALPVHQGIRPSDVLPPAAETVAVRRPPAAEGKAAPRRKKRHAAALIGIAASVLLGLFCAWQLLHLLGSAAAPENVRMESVSGQTDDAGEDASSKDRKTETDSPEDGETESGSPEEGKTELVSTETASDVVLTGISIQSLPAKTSYTVGDTLTPAGLVLEAAFSDGTTRTLVGGFTYSPTVLDKVGTQEITVTFGGKTDVFQVTVQEAQVTLITVKTFPAKTIYALGDTLDVTGLTLKASYSDGTTKTITSGFNVTPTALNKAGTQEITVSYSGKATFFYVTVQDAQLTGISARTLPTKTVYHVGNTLDVTGLTLEAAYSDGTTKVISGGFTCSPTALDKAGTQKITVSYDGKTTSFDVTVNGSVPREITWNGVDVYFWGGYNENSAVVLRGEQLSIEFTCTPYDNTGFTLENSFGGKSYVNSYSDESAMCITVDMPDDPSVQGWQSVTVIVDGTRTVFWVNLTYLGAYSQYIGTDFYSDIPYSDIGWKVVDWYIE